MMRKLMNISPAEVLIVLCILCITVLICWPIYTRVTSYIPGCPDVRLQVEEDGVIIMSWSGETGDVTYATPKELRQMAEYEQRTIDRKKKERLEARRGALQRIREARRGN